MNKMEPDPCKCGIKHVHGDGNYEFFMMKMVTDDSPLQLPPRRTARCKFCKEVLTHSKQPEPERLNPETNDEKLKILFPNGKCPYCKKGIWESFHHGCDSLNRENK